MNNMVLGLQLMLIGMVTVFVILLVVIYGSELLIRIVNKVAPAAQAQDKRPAGAEDDVMPVLEAAVAAITGGRGHITKVTKIN